MKKYSICGILKHSDRLIPFLVYSGVLILAAVWLSSILAVPLWIRGSSAGKLSAGFVRYFFSSICHQMPERSFHLFNHPLGVCARCTGIYAGFFLGTMLFPCVKRIGEKGTSSLWILCVAALPTAAEWLLAHHRVVESSNWIRCTTGLILGSALAFWVLPAVFQLASVRNQIKG